MENKLSSIATQGTKLRDRLKIEKPELSYSDFHSGAMKDLDNISSCLLNHQKQQVERKGIENEELVKYMSNLPSYLEREEKLQEKAFNVGVLNWRHLEKWQYNHKRFHHRSRGYSSSSSNASSFFSTDESSTLSSRDRSCSPSRQRMHRRPTLQSLLSASPSEGYSQGVKSFEGNIEKFQDLKNASSGPLKGQQIISGTYQSFNKNHSDIRPKEYKLKESCQQTNPGIKFSVGVENSRAKSCSKGKMNIHDVKSTKGVEKFQEQHDGSVDNNCLERHKTIILLLPRDDHENKHSAVSCPSDLTAINGQKSSEKNRRSFQEVSFPDEVYLAEHYSDISHSCPLPCEVDNIKCSEFKQSSTMDAKGIKCSSGKSQPAPSSAKKSINPLGGKNVEEKSSGVMLANSTVTKNSQGSDLKMDTVAASKVRNPSPTRRFSINIGRIVRSSSSKDGSAVLKLKSKHVTANSGSGKEKAETPASSDYSTSDKPNGTSRAHTSPLRRLLDPLLKPKTANSHHFADPLPKDSSSLYKDCRSSGGRVESCTVHSVNAKLDFTGGRTISSKDSHNHEKHGSSMVQALLKIVIKNGLPLFTFAVDNNSDVLAATMKKYTSRKDENGWIYTFFTIGEVRKKKGRRNQESKSKGHGYVPNVVAQMQVSTSQSSNLTRHDSVNQFSIREFVLFAVDLKQADQQTSSLQPNNELAAIVVKCSKEPPRNMKQDEQQSESSGLPSVIVSKEPLPDFRSCCNSSDNKTNGSSGESQDLFSLTAILPGGVHGLPSKGEPSPLIARWKSGGLCDCGGWDLGCRIRVLANQTQHHRRSSSSTAHPTVEQFKLFSQGEEIQDRPIFSLSTFDDGIFSVEFNSSLSHLQAFSICIAVLNVKKPFEVLESRNFLEEKSSEATTIAENDEIKPPNHVKVEVPARYASLPPLSPVGRA